MRAKSKQDVFNVEIKWVAINGNQYIERFTLLNALRKIKDKSPEMYKQLGDLPIDLAIDAIERGFQG